MKRAERCATCAQEIVRTRHGWIHRKPLSRLEGHPATPQENQESAR